MAKIKHNNFIDTVDEVLSGAKREGVLHLYAEDKILTGRTSKLRERKCFILVQQVTWDSNKTFG